MLDIETAFIPSQISMISLWFHEPFTEGVSRVTRGHQRRNRAPDMITYMSGGAKDRAQHRANSGEFLKTRALCTSPGHPTQINQKR